MFLPRASAGRIVATALVVFLSFVSVRDAPSAAAQAQDPPPGSTFQVELDPARPSTIPSGEHAGIVPGGSSFTTQFQAHSGWAYRLSVVPSLRIQQMSVDISGPGGPAGGFQRTQQPWDSSTVAFEWTATADGPVSVTVDHLVVDPETVAVDPGSELQPVARVSVAATPLDDRPDDARDATMIALDQTVSGVFELGTDADAFAFFAEPGYDYRIDGSIAGVTFLSGTLWDVADFDAVDPADVTPVDLRRVERDSEGIMVSGLVPTRTGLHYFVVSGAGDGVNAPYTVRVTRTPVTTTVNTSDIQFDGVCDFHHCSLPEAIEAANTRPGTQTVTFNIPGAGVHRITPDGGGLPLLRDGIVIDGTTQPGYAGTPVIVVDGAGAGFSHGISNLLADASVTVKGLAIVNFQRTAVNLNAGSAHTVASNFIGFDPQTKLPGPNLEGGISVTTGGGHTIGAPGAGNVVASNGEYGISLSSGALDGTSVQGNRVGTNDDDAALGNGGPGLRILGAGAAVRVGGAEAGAGNVFAHNGEAQVQVAASIGPLDVWVAGNVFIVADAGSDGVTAQLRTRGELRVGGEAEGEGNTFSGPFASAVEIDIDGPLPQFTVIHAGNTHDGNVVGLDITESAGAEVDIVEEANLFLGDGRAIKAELKAAGSKSFGAGSRVIGSGQASASFTADASAGVRIAVALSGEYDRANAAIATRGEGTVDVEVTGLTVNNAPAPEAGLHVEVGASGRVTMDGFRAEQNAAAGAVIRVGQIAGNPVSATVEVKNSVVLDSGTGIIATHSATSDVSWNFSGNVFRNNRIGLDVAANAGAGGSYDLESNTYEGQADLGFRGSFNPLRNLAIDFSTRGEAFDSNLRHADFGISGAGKVTIRVLDLTGTSTAGRSNEAGLRYRITADIGASLDARVDLRRTSITGSLGAGLRAEAAIPDFGSAFIEANASQFDGNRQGAALFGWSFRFSEEPNSFSDNLEFGIVAEDSSVSITNDTINGNGSGIVVRRGSAVRVADNSISGNNGDGLTLEATKDAAVEGNVFVGNGGIGVSVASDSGASLAGNVFGDNAGGDIGGQGEVSGVPTSAARVALAIISADFQPNGELVLVYSISGEETAEFPLAVTFIESDPEGRPRSTGFHTELFEILEEVTGEMNAVVPAAEAVGIDPGDLVVAVASAGAGGISSPVAVAGSRTDGQGSPPLGSLPGPAVPATPLPEDSDVVGEDSAAAGESAGGGCSPADGVVSAEYVLLGSLVVGLAARRVTAG